MKIINSYTKKNNNNNISNRKETQWTEQGDTTTNKFKNAAGKVLKL